MMAIKRPKSPHIADGVWLWCRHPNYLGEILFWWGLWAMQTSLAPTLWTIIGPAAITLLFAFVSIPMMDRMCCILNRNMLDTCGMCRCCCRIGVFRARPGLEQKPRKCKARLRARPVSA